MLCRAGIYALTGCTTGLNKMVDRMYASCLTKSYNHPADHCFNATFAALRDLRIKVRKSDRAKGLLVTDRTVFLEYSHGSAGCAQLVTRTHRYHIKISGAAGKSTVAVTMFRDRVNNVEQTKLSHAWFAVNVRNPLFNEIKVKLDEMQRCECRVIRFKERGGRGN